jgi:hypothetical protein
MAYRECYQPATSATRLARVASSSRWEEDADLRPRLYYRVVDGIGLDVDQEIEGIVLIDAVVSGLPGACAAGGRQD